MLTLALTGDVMLGRYVNEMLKSISPAEVWNDLLPHLEQADLRVVNLECALTGHLGEWKRTPKQFHFRADPQAAVRVLQAADIDACMLANNHTLDFEERGLRDTLRTLGENGIRYAGAGLNAAEAAKPAVLEVQGGSRRVAMLSYTDNEPAFAATADRPGTNYLEVSLQPDTLERVAAGIGQAREEGADLVVVSNHWGPNFVERPSQQFRNFARRVIELGADIYYGHSAHILQGIEIHRGKPILYDTGNLIDDYAVHPLLRNDRSCLFTVAFEENRLRRIELLPVSLDVGYVALARSKEFEAICARMEMPCAELGTKLTRRADRLIYEG